MKATISTSISTSAEQMWNELQKVSSLVHVASPLLIFKSQDKYPLPEQWHIGQEYALSVFIFGIIPLGKHVIKIIKIDAQNMQILSNEYGVLTRTWNHLIKVEKDTDYKIRYTDEIEIKAGMLTIAIWLFAQIFYRHRQKRWKKLIGR